MAWCRRGIGRALLTRACRDGFEADRRLQQQQSGAFSKAAPQRKSPPVVTANLVPTSSESFSEAMPSADSTPSPAAAAVAAAAAAGGGAAPAATDKSTAPAPAPAAANLSSRPPRSAAAAAAAGGSSDRFAARTRDGSDPDYDRHYGKYAPRNAMVPGGMTWPVMPAGGGGYGMPVAGMPMGAQYEAMSPM